MGLPADSVSITTNAVYGACDTHTTKVVHAALHTEAGSRWRQSLPGLSPRQRAALCINVARTEHDLDATGGMLDTQEIEDAADPTEQSVDFW